MKNDRKIEFRCTDKEKERVYKKADRQGLSVKDYLLNSSIYKRGRSGFNTVQKAALCRIATSLNKIDNGVEIQKETEKIIEECRELCLSLKR